MPERSITQWICRLKEGSDEAAQRLWQRYAAQLVQHARKRLEGTPKRFADEEDVALSVFYSVCRGAAAGRLQNVKNRDELWWLLLAITRQKAVDYIRRETALKRGAGRPHNRSASSDSEEKDTFSLDELIGSEPSPEFMIMLQEQHDRLLGLLQDDLLRRLAVSRIEGFTIQEIAYDFGMSSRSIERKLALIRSYWSRELECESSQSNPRC